LAARWPPSGLSAATAFPSFVDLHLYRFSRKCVDGRNDGAYNEGDKENDPAEGEASTGPTNKEEQAPMSAKKNVDQAQELNSLREELDDLREQVYAIRQAFKALAVVAGTVEPEMPELRRVV
jgi:hypothetical protein